MMLKAQGRRMDQKPVKARRGPRKDSLRNREALVDAARDVFAEGGTTASLEAVARRAGVGIATLYRHFPTRDALFQAVYRHEVDDLVTRAERAVAGDDPVEALRSWLHANVGVVATKKGMLAALAPNPDASRALFEDSRTRLVASIEALMEPARAVGAIRTDVAADDVLRAFFGICYSQEGPDWQAKVVRLLDVFIDGLRIHG
jgi:AcrR family transcriptional regulator